MAGGSESGSGSADMDGSRGGRRRSGDGGGYPSGVSAETNDVSAEVKDVSERMSGGIAEVSPHASGGGDGRRMSARTARSGRRAAGMLRLRAVLLAAACSGA